MAITASSTYPVGDRYEGQFQNFEPLLGIYFGGGDRDYSEKAGQWANGKLNGYAVITKTDGGSVAGAFKDDAMTGLGAKFDAAGHVLQQGFFAQNDLTKAMTAN